jgi:hypothetical protein
MDVRIYRQEPPEDIGMLIQLLGSDRMADRKKARVELVRAGPLAVPALLKLASNPRTDLRWEIVHTLGEIGDPRAAPGLVIALEDDHYEVRWCAAEGLINLEREGLIPLFKGLRDRFGSPRLREGAHHVLRVLKNKGYLGGPALKVLEALDSIEPEATVPWAARKALDFLYERETHTTSA